MSPFETCTLLHTLNRWSAIIILQSYSHMNPHPGKLIKWQIKLINWWIKWWIKWTTRWCKDFATNKKLLNPGRLQKHGVCGNMDNIDGGLAFGWDFDLPCPASLCRPDNPSQDRRPDIQPTFCPLSRRFRSDKWIRLQSADLYYEYLVGAIHQQRDSCMKVGTYIVAAKIVIKKNTKQKYSKVRKVWKKIKKKSWSYGYCYYHHH